MALPFLATQNCEGSEQPQGQSQFSEPPPGGRALSRPAVLESLQVKDVPAISPFFS